MGLVDPIAVGPKEKLMGGFACGDIFLTSYC
uniref:Uncharacterized protein n=1 Tax=Nelumbo nucifera TaxID=4432 RepID=A0A822ZCC2_NELNU|nr:TPA_asm: hypothetical protein HUJ06_000413 [Nelumbo nucifera]